MDDVAARAGVSRATVYRLFPGKDALFEALLTTYAPLDRVIALIEDGADRPPEELIPAGYRLVASVASADLGVLRAMIAEVASGSPDAVEGAVRPFQELFIALDRYFERQMAAGAIAPMDTMLAAQALLGPLLNHLLTWPLASRVAGHDVPPGRRSGPAGGGRGLTADLRSSNGHVDTRRRRRHSGACRTMDPRHPSDGALTRSRQVGERRCSNDWDP